MASAIGIHTVRRLSFLAVAVSAATAVSCARQQQVAAPGAAPSNAPAWVNRGSGAFNDGNRSFYGVGLAAGIRNPALSRTASDNRARAEVATSLEVYITSVTRDYARSVGNMSASEEEQLVEQTTRSFVNMTVSGVRIIDHWQDPQSGTLYALAKLDLAQTADTVERMDQLNAQTREYIRQNAERAFDRLEQMRTERRP